MRNVLIAGAGQSGLQLAIALQNRGYQVSLISDRTPDEIRSGHVMSTQCMFHSALQLRRDLGIHFWEEAAPRIERLGISISQQGSAMVDWMAPLDGYAQSIDQRLQVARWLEAFVDIGGRLIIQKTSPAMLDEFAGTQDLILVATGRTGLASLFPINATHTTFDTNQRILGVAYVHGFESDSHQGGLDAVRCIIVPGVGELFTIPALTIGGRADILFWEVLPGSPGDVFARISDPDSRLRAILELMKRYVPWEYSRAQKVELTDRKATLVGGIVPVVRRPVGVLPSGRLVFGIADSVVTNDPITGQGANSATKCAALYLSAIVAQADLPFDRDWMEATFARYWTYAQHVTRWTNALLAPPPPHVIQLLRVAGEVPAVARRFVNGFDDPSDFEAYFYDPISCAAWLSQAQQRRPRMGVYSA
jgi:2-polyprenyl-6-methoxyphenol hydroxylase-like FAD-dependent oxidoreductase